MTGLATWRERFGLAPHPEGGWFVETFRAAREVQTPAGPRAASTAILYALPDGGTSAWHRVVHDEVWHRYEGGRIRLHLLDEAGYRVIVLGCVEAGHVPAHTVPGGTWQAAEAEGDVLVGCTVAPGFDFADFELANADALASDFPDHAEVARRLSAPEEDTP